MKQLIQMNHFTKEKLIQLHLLLAHEGIVDNKINIYLSDIKNNSLETLFCKF